MHQSDVPSKTKPVSAVMENFKKSLPNRILMLAAAWDNYLRDEKDDTELANLLIIIDSLSNSCDMHGMDFFSAALREVEEQISEFSVSDADKKNGFRPSIASRIQVLETLANKDKPTDKPQDAPKKVYGNQQKEIAIVSSDTELIRELSIQIGHYGYKARAFTDEQNFVAALNTDGFSSVIVDVDHFEGGMEGLSRMKEGYANPDAEPPLIILDSNTDFMTRLSAVKLGCQSFFGKPVNVGLLLDKMDSLIIGSSGDPYRILIVDDSATSAKYITRTLEGVGMIAQIETSPDKVLIAIAEFNPDLILMDMYMPMADGDVVSKIIRQYESLISVPIVFLSSEANLKKQLLAMQVGADDFLTKPIEPEHLIQSISIRCKRYRALNSLMQQDSLTGLLNHTKIKQRLTDALSKAARTQTPVSFAMIDIDKFKSVNDTYGHPTGDKVIKSLSRLLQRRLRRSDIIGRYGGEEFAVVFWDTPTHAAMNVLDAIRRDFSKIEQFSDDGKIFYCSFSAGIASAPTFTDPAEINKEADLALYTSKNNGRNQITIAPLCR